MLFRSLREHVELYKACPVGRAPQRERDRSLHPNPSPSLNLSRCGCQTSAKLVREVLERPSERSLSCHDRVRLRCPFSLGCPAHLRSSGPYYSPTLFLVSPSFFRPFAPPVRYTVHAGVSSSNPKRWIQQPLARSPHFCRPSPRGERAQSRLSASTRPRMCLTLPSCPQRRPPVLLHSPQRPPTQTPSAGLLLADPIPET